MNKYLFTLFILTGIYFSQCTIDPVERPVDNMSAEYFPLTPGKFIVYAVDSIVFDDSSEGNVKDTVSFQLKEEVSGFQIDLTNDTLYYIHRSRRNNPSENWVVTDVWTAQKSSVEAIKTEENLKFRKMNFPLRKGKHWTPTSYISPNTVVTIGTESLKPFQDWNAKVTDFDEAGEVGNFSFQDGQLMRISQVDIDDGSIKRYLVESYARNIGLVARNDSILDSRCFALGDFTPCLDKSWNEQAGKGYILAQVMIDHN